MRQFVRHAMILIGLALLPAPAWAADMWLVSNHFSVQRFVPHIHYAGPVMEGDAEALASLFDEVVECDVARLPKEGGNCAVLTLSSPGGNYIEGLKLALLLRERAVATVVEAYSSCYSACAFAFLGGSGFSSQDGIGPYSDRMVEPRATLGFHAPYFASEDLDTLVADFGMDAVLGASRNDIALMVEQLVDWNVDASILSYIASMGPDESYDVKTGEDYYLSRSHLPPSPLGQWINDNSEAIRNACLRLLAHHRSAYIDSSPEVISETFLTDFAANEAGQMLSGFRIGPDNPLGVTFCGLPTEKSGLMGDVDLSLYTAPGVSGAARPMLSLFHRPDGWSSLGAGGAADRRHFKKGGFNEMFTQPFMAMGDQSTDTLTYLGYEKFAYYNPDFPSDSGLPRPQSDLAMSVAVSTRAADTIDYEDHRIVVQMGNQLLFDQARDVLLLRNVDTNLNSVTADGFVYGGTYPSGRPFLWFSLYAADKRLVALVEIEAKSVPADLNRAVAEQYEAACSFSFEGHTLLCQ
ncbi:hypothetical protein GCM10007989_27190 [Devosia pacifica]|uniref:Uncharacterized protein n=1 Tax=Devosia pacifica TaxID=1335967 RepID=A0A918S8G7_9HYPH|nr:hypothetical protein [Devosia pacifica]GHA30075.1 hypothetical protein GCM10007989_27190 [Devosia pacifica]